MRKLAMLTVAMFGLALAPSYAQPAQSAPGGGLPPGAGSGAPNAYPPSGAGSVSTPTSPSASPMPYADATTPAPRRRVRHRRYARHHVVHHRTYHHRRMARHAAPAATDTPAPAAQ